MITIRGIDLAENFLNIQHIFISQTHLRYWSCSVAVLDPDCSSQWCSPPLLLGTENRRDEKLNIGAKLKDYFPTQSWVLELWKTWDVWGWSTNDWLSVKHLTIGLCVNAKTSFTITAAVYPQSATSLMPTDFWWPDSVSLTATWMEVLVHCRSETRAPCEAPDGRFACDASPNAITWTFSGSPRPGNESLTPRLLIVFTSLFPLTN